MNMNLDAKNKYVLTVDCVVFGYADDRLSVALIARKNEPFAGRWALPGGFLEGNETVEQTAIRELEEETGIHGFYLEQFHVFSEPYRDPRGRIITVGFFALIPSDKITLTATQDAAQARWFPIYTIPQLAFDHDTLYAKAINALRDAVITKPLVFELLPKEFTLSALQNIYEQIFDLKLDKRNFRKKVQKTDFIQQTTKTTRGGKYRPARLYQFNKKRYLENKITHIF